MSRTSGKSKKGLRDKRQKLVRELIDLESEISELKGRKIVRECELLELETKLGMLGGD